MLNTHKQLEAISRELEHMKKLRYKLSNQLRHLKEFHLFRQIIRKIRTQLVPAVLQIQGTDIKKIHTIDCATSISHVNSLIQKMQDFGNRIKGFIQKVLLIQFATLALGGVAMLYTNCQKILKKLEALHRIQGQLKKDQSKIKPANPANPGTAGPTK